jgi:hypothetical protein
MAIGQSSNPGDGWVRQTRGTAGSRSRGIATDNAGNVYVTGEFKDAVDFGGSSLVSAGDYDGYVAKYRPNGALVWVRGIGGGEADGGDAIAVDDLGNVYVRGYISSDVVFGEAVFESPSGRGFLAHYSSNGELRWARRTGIRNPNQPPGSWSYGKSVAVDRMGRIYTTGSVYGSAGVDGASLATAATPDFFVARFRSDGTVEWAHSVAGGGEEVGENIATDADANIYVTGTGRPAEEAPSSSQFVAKFNATGNLLWSSHPEMTYVDDQITGIAVDAEQNVFISGKLWNRVKFDDFELEGRFDAFVVKYLPDGTVAWAKQSAGAEIATAQGIALDASGDVYLTGGFAHEADFGGIRLLSSAKREMTGSHSNDVFVVKYRSSDGMVLSARQAGGPLFEDIGTDVAVDGSDNVFITGYFEGEAAFDRDSVSANGYGQSFIWKPGTRASRIHDESTMAVDRSGRIAVVYSGYYEIQIEIEVVQSGDTRLAVCDLSGREVAIVYDGPLPAGTHLFQLPLVELANGRYFLQMRTRSETVVERLQIVR